MEKEFEVLEAKPEDIGKLLYEVYDVPSSICEYINKALLELKSIKEANFSEAMKCLDSLRKSANTFCQHIPEQCELNKKYADTIKQALLKAQDQEKVLNVIKKKKVEVMALFLSSSVEQYNNQFIRDKNKLTQEEFDLLKGYFKWERK